MCDSVTEKDWKVCYHKGVKEKRVGASRHAENQKIKVKSEELIMSVKSVNKANFEEIKRSEKPVLLDFYADWCGPCRMVSPIVDEIAEERDDIVVGKINVDAEPELAEAFGVISIPTLVVLKDGQIVNRVSGARPKAQILSLL